jgi:type IV pilus assembly protein PilF
MGLIFRKGISSHRQHRLSGIGFPSSAIRYLISVIRDRITIFLWCLLLVAAGLPACQTGPQQKDDALTHMRLGDSLLQEGRIPQALSEVLKASELDPENPTIRNLLGIIYLEKDLTPQAIEQFQMALKLDPKYTEVQNNLGTAFLRSGQFQEALLRFNKTLADPLYTTPHFAYYNLGQTYMAMNDFQMAIRQFNEAIRLAPNYSLAYHGLGLSYKATGNLQKASSAFKKAIEFAPRFAQAHYNLGEVLLQLNEKSLARRAFQEVDRLVPESELGRKAEQRLRELK